MGSDNKENTLYDKKWLVGTAVNSLSMCKDGKCLYETPKIARGELRIGRRGPSRFDENSIQIYWFHAKCMFSQQLRSRQSTQVIEKEDDMDGFYELLLADQDYIRELIQGNIDILYGGNPLPNATPAKHRPSTEPNSASRPSKRKSVTPGGKDEAKPPKTPSSGRRDVGRILML